MSLQQLDLFESSVPELAIESGCKQILHPTNPATVYSNFFLFLYYIYIYIYWGTIRKLQNIDFFTFIDTGS